MKTIRAALATAIASVLAACAATPRHASAVYPTVERPWVSLPGEPQIESDRRAIRAMVGEYEVRFAFEETVILAPGYVRRDSKDTGGFEAVVVVEDSPRRIVLQHLLVSEDGQHVTKHWRQDWTYQAAARFEFTQALTWRVRAIPAELTRGAWTQCVYEVNDAPRYCGTGRWDHSLTAPTWTSDPSWRPLPRREFTKRSDYDAIRAVNRHSIGPTGWTHEQDNIKVVRRGEVIEKSLVRESGFNDYRRISGFDFTPAYDYWRDTASYWAQVRGAWAETLAANAGLRLHTKIDGMALIIPLFTQAEAVKDGQQADPREIRKALDAWVTGPDATTMPPSSAPAEPG